MATNEQNTQAINALTEQFNQLKNNSKNIEDLTAFAATLDPDVVIMVRFDSGGGFETFKITAQQILDLAANTVLDVANFNPQVSPPAHQEARFYYDANLHAFTVFNDELDVSLQVGEEIWKRIKNNTGGTILNGSPCYLSGIDGLIPTVELAKADLAATSLATIGIATHDIEDGTEGYITRVGTVRDVDTQGLNSGDILFLSGDVAGDFTTVRPPSPNYDVRLGVVGLISALGNIDIQISVGSNTVDVIKIFNGATLETTDVTASSDGVNISLTLDDAAANGFLSLFFDADFKKFTTPDSINLIPGTFAFPVKNYIYIPKSTMVLTVNTSDFPRNEQVVPVATISCQDVVSAQTDGLRSVQIWTDHLADQVGQGHLNQVNEWIRDRPAAWKSGVVISSNPLEGVTVATIDIATTIGVIRQLHLHSFPLKDTSTGSFIHLVNDSVSPYKKITSLNSTDFSLDSEGVTMANKYFSVVLFGVVSQDAADSQWYMNLPSGSYNGSADAIAEISNYANSNIPTQFNGTGFLQYRIVCKNVGGNIQIVTDGIINLRGETGGLGGGSIGGGGITNYLQLTDTPTDRIGQAGKVLVCNPGETADEYSNTPTGILITESQISDLQLYYLANNPNGYIPVTGGTFTGAITAVGIKSEIADLGTGWKGASPNFYHVDADAVLDLVSDDSGSFGSGMSFKQVTGTTFNNSWDVGRKTNSGGFFIRYGITPDANSNADKFILSTSGNGIFTGSVTASSIVKSGGTSTQTLKADGSVSAGYKVYTAIMNQVGTSAPTAIVLENTLGGTVVWTRTAVGGYLGTLIGAFTNNKTLLFASSRPKNGVTDQFGITYSTTDEVLLSSVKDTVLTDGMITDISIEIRVYD